MATGRNPIQTIYLNEKSIKIIFHNGRECFSHNRCFLLHPGSLSVVVGGGSCLRNQLFSIICAASGEFILLKPYFLTSDLGQLNGCVCVCVCRSKISSVKDIPVKTSLYLCTSNKPVSHCQNLGKNIDKFFCLLYKLSNSQNTMCKLPKHALTHRATTHCGWHDQQAKLYMMKLRKILKTIAAK